MSAVELKINDIATKSRIWLEKTHSKNFPSHFCGACAIASTFILRQLILAEIPAKVMISKIIGGQHAFVETDDYVIDITAQQFQRDVDRYLPDIIVRHKDERREQFWQDIQARLLSPEDVINFTSEPKWPDEQIPNLNEMEVALEDI